MKKVVAKALVLMLVGCGTADPPEVVCAARYYNANEGTLGMAETPSGVQFNNARAAYLLDRVEGNRARAEDRARELAKDRDAIYKDGMTAKCDALMPDDVENNIMSAATPL